MVKKAAMLVSMEQASGIVSEMRSEIWSRLPTALVTRVLMRLGIADEARLTVVCKAWRNLFLSAWFRVERGALGFSGCNELWILDPFDPKVGSLLLNASPEDRCRQVTLHLDFLPIGHCELLNWKDVACMCGLILTHSSRDGTGCIWNLANKTWRMLPPLSDDLWGGDLWGHLSPYPRVHVVASEEHGASTIQLWATLWDFAMETPFLAVCSSNCWVWNKVVTLEPPTDAVDVRPNSGQSMVVCKGVVYVIPNVFSSPVLEYYDMVTGKFLGRHSLPEGNSCDKVWKGLSVVGDKVYYTFRVGNCIAIWEWNDRAFKWRQASVLPLERTQVKSVFCMDVHVATGTILICLFGLEGAKGWYLFAYCIAQDSWRSVVSLPASSYEIPHAFLTGELRPRLRL